MGAHERTPTVEPIWYARQRWLRTALQTALAFLVGLGGSVAVLQTTAPQVLAALADLLPVSWLAWLAGVFAIVIGVATALAKLMAIPVVNAWLARGGFGSVPRTVAIEGPEPVTTAGYPAAEKTEPDDALG